MQLNLALSESILKPVLNGQKGDMFICMCFHWLKRKQVNIPVHDEDAHEFTCVCLSGYVKVT